MSQVDPKSKKRNDKRQSSGHQINDKMMMNFNDNDEDECNDIK